MLQIENLNYASNETILFQRLSVIVTDFIYIYSIYECSKILPKGKRAEIILPILLIANPGLLMIDHIHFQYNGMLFGIFLLSISNIIQDKMLVGTIWFSILLNMKHIFIYVAPAYFIYLLRNYCFNRNSNKVGDFFKSFSIKNFFRLGLIVITIFAIAFAPFIDHIDQVISRMFPFKRGLCHAYWAPNVWALYNTIDKISTLFASKMGVSLKLPTASMTGGLVKEFSHTILPNITPRMTMILSAVAMLPAIIKLWNLGPKPCNFVRCIVLCALSSFMFGWHVHEKAILMAIIPLSIVAVMEPGDANIFLLLSTIGHYSLFPLLFPQNLLCIKLFLLLIYSCYAFYSLYSLYIFQFCKYTLPLLSSIESIYVLGLVPLFIYTEIVHSLLGLGENLPFIPLMMTSIYCAIGVLYCWIKYYRYFLIKCK